MKINIYRGYKRFLIGDRQLTDEVGKLTKEVTSLEKQMRELREEFELKIDILRKINIEDKDKITILEKRIKEKNIKIQEIKGEKNEK